MDQGENIVFPEQFTVGRGHGASAGLPLTGKGANKTPPDRAAEVFPRPVVALPFAAVRGAI